ncbi:hypothetical protein K458DRAFT_355046 [Lentithecium fluviatile CBS 122367]|uniref:Tyrosine specific protein phosphatases domain-containing protein n=1 Tax=Lentithecium fluviatile CBS 122367 TaxID=1168545 RepID=A0A6G1JKN4_9PLEO|nr:hypothetical protein K458DRAFT_355046 [Lentithecium fluviatile CBS 122367]
MSTEPNQSSLYDLINTDIRTPIPAPLLTQALTEPPFIPIPGITNLRDLGRLPSSPIRPNLFYRSGALQNLPSASLTRLRDDLGVKLVLDLRSKGETARSPDPEIEGIKNAYFESKRVPRPIEMVKFIDEGGKRGYVELYDEVLDIYEESVRGVLEWVRDGGGPVLFHCTAGKDRTGVLAAIFLSLAGASDETIAFDYALTRVGIEPAREFLLGMLKVWNTEWTTETPGMAEFSSVKGDFILGMMEMMESKYGGVEGYVRGLGFGEEDLRKIRAVLRGD